MTPASTHAFRIAIITVSDRAARGVYEDKSGPAARDALTDALGRHELAFELAIVPDEPAHLQECMRGCLDRNCDFLFTTGGPGSGRATSRRRSRKRCSTKNSPAWPRPCAPFP
jgi:molybdopterin biosynthesis enzyme MoaB